MLKYASDSNAPTNPISAEGESAGAAGLGATHRLPTSEGQTVPAAPSENVPPKASHWLLAASLQKVLSPLQRFDAGALPDVAFAHWQHTAAASRAVRTRTAMPSTVEPHTIPIALSVILVSPSEAWAIYLDSWDSASRVFRRSRPTVRSGPRLPLLWCAHRFELKERTDGGRPAPVVFYG